jgi:hypothetical protein
VNELTVLFEASLAIDDNDKFLTNVLTELLSASLAKSTWDKYCSGWRAWLDFELSQENCIAWPVSIENFRKFAVWCIGNRCISHRTTISYLYSVAIAHSLKNLPCVDYNSDKTLKLLLNGAKNLGEPRTNVSQGRRVANISTLKLISHALASCDWHKISRQVIWSCCTLAFFASLRIGEILSSNCASFDPTSTLLWKHVKFLCNDSVLLYIPCTKTKKYTGEFVDVFPLEGNFCCPVSALKLLLQIHLELNIFDFEQPVFSFGKHNFLTTRKLNDVLKNLLSPWYDPNTDVISCHSFRGAVINIMQNNMSLFKPEECRLYGRWESDAYLYYLKNHHADRKLTFEKLSSLIVSKK